MTNPTSYSKQFTLTLSSLRKAQQELEELTKGPKEPKELAMTARSVASEITPFIPPAPATVAEKRKLHIRAPEFNHPPIEELHTQKEREIQLLSDLKELRALIEPTRALGDEDIAKLSGCLSRLMPSLRGVFSSLPGLKDKTDDDLIAYFSRNPSVVLSIYDSSGLPAIDTLISSFAKRIEKYEHMIELITLDDIIRKNPNNKKLQKDSFDLLSKEVQNSLAYYAWKMNGQRTDGMCLLQQDMIRAIECNGQSPIIAVYQDLETQLNELANIPLLQKDEGMTDEQYGYKRTSAILGLIHKTISTSSPSKENIVHLLSLLPEETRSFLFELVWRLDGEPAGDVNYGKNLLENHPKILLNILNSENKNILTQLEELYIKQSTSTEPLDLSSMLDGLKDVKTMTSAKRLSEITASAAKPKIAMIAAEYKPVIAQGGLAEAVVGMAESLKGRDICVIMPKYEGIKLPKDAHQDTDHSVPGCGIFKATINDIDVYLIEHKMLFTLDTSDGKTASIYQGSDAHIKARFAHFQNFAAQLAMKLYDESKVDVIHVHDSQSALVPKIIATKYPTKYAKGETPATVFTFHNNLQGSQGQYIGPDAQASLRAIGLENRPTNSMYEGLDYADAVTTVSSKFAEEAASDGILGRDLGRYVRKARNNGKLFDVLNGISSSWDPKTNPVLKNWVSVDSLDLDTPIKPILHLELNILPGDTKKEAESKMVDFMDSIEQCQSNSQPFSLDLTYGPDDHPLRIQFIKRMCKEQLSQYVEKYGLGKIDANKPLLLNIGRFDASQKGIGKLPLILSKAQSLGAQMISIGLDGETCPAEMTAMKAISERYKNDGIIVVDDFKQDGKIFWQQGHKAHDGKEVPGIGPILRAAADIGVFPSEFEPCGLVQGEAFSFGCKVLATDTGGFHDTVFIEGKNRNGWLFAREENWQSGEQDRAIEAKLEEAVKEWNDVFSQDVDAEDDTAIEEYYKQMKKIMANAKQSGWSEVPTGQELSASGKLDRIYQHAIERRSLRSKLSFDLRKVTTMEI